MRLLAFILKGIVFLVLWGALSCSATDQKPSAGMVNAGGWQELNLQHDGLKRWFRVYRPAELPPDAAVVVLLHGGTQSMRKIFRPRSGGTQEWRRVAEQEKFLLLVPNGTNPKTGDTFGNHQNWNDVRLAASVNNPPVDDVGFLAALLDWAGQKYAVDRTRLYVTGASNGGMMTYRLLMELSDRIAAGAAFIANLPVDDRRMRIPDRPVPLLICNGTEDPLVRWEGGEIPGGRGNLRSARQTVAWWVKANRANSQRPESFPVQDSDPDDGCRLYRTLYPPLAGGTVVEFIRMQGGGHTLPSKRHPLPERLWIKRLFGPACRDVEGAWLAWDFLKRYRLAD
jgi:polyhydroxybutyrate depolymerase